tara:strand:+ start:111 stop:278 length:168 start_codon:yes stop_codon:yes gene_type:complete
MIAQKKLDQVNEKIIIKLQDEQIARLKDVIKILELRNDFLEDKISRAMKWKNTEV